ncbi:MAG: acyl-CoA dehydrogenase family protein [Steroidobacteraceae bacterium]
MIAALQALTAGYLGARKQFGQPLARQQVLRHRMADVALAGLRARALTAHLEQVFAALAPAERTRRASAAIAKALEGVRYAAEQAVQLHGGMGVSAELPIGRYLRRVLALEATLGSADHHRARYLAAFDP